MFEKRNFSQLLRKRQNARKIKEKGKIRSGRGDIGCRL
jgi:hypothetical protein